MPDNRPHFEIPLARVRTTDVAVRGRSKPYSRPDFSAHGDFLRERAARVAEYSASTADAGATEALFLQVRTPTELPARGERQRLQNAGLEIVALSAIDPNSATVRLKRSEVRTLQDRVERYANTVDHTGRSYLSIIEDIGPVPLTEKIAADVPSDDDTPFDCLLVFYATLTDRERAAVLLASPPPVLGHLAP